MGIWNHDDGVRLLQVTVGPEGVATFREDGRMYQPRDECSLQEFATCTGRGALIRNEIVSELPAAMVAEIDQNVRQLIGA